MNYNKEVLAANQHKKHSHWISLTHRLRVKIKMQDSPKTSGSSLEDHKAGLLDTPKIGPPRRRSTSVGSARSGLTIVDNQSDVPVLDRKKVQRRRTQVATVKISWWQCLKGVFLGPQVTERAARKTINIPEAEEDDDIFANGDCPWILTVHALDKVGTDLHQQARCTFDTGCLQGNIISKEFALRLGYTESDFKPLNPKEKNGGTSATGHTHMPEGALYIKWYHNSSPRLYSGMRFLVSSDTDCQLIIGARSILRHKLLSAPNLGVEEDRAGITKFNPGSDKALDKLRGSAAKLANDIATLKHKLREAKNDKKETEVSKLETEIEKKKAKLTIKTLEVELYSARKDLLGDPESNNKQAVVKVIEDELKAAKGKKPEGPSSAKPPQVNISGTNGNTRSATGFSSRSGGRTMSRRR